MGARLAPPPARRRQHDVDLFDPYCEHLLVRARAGVDMPGPVIGTYRVLTPTAARRIGGLYSDTEFDLTRLRPLRHRMVELGRSCVHADWRIGGVILALWAALGEFMTRNRLDTMVGCASISMRDGGHIAASLWEQLARDALGADRVAGASAPAVAGQTNCNHEPGSRGTALIKGYLRCGAKVLGPPAWDPDFNTADLPLLMRLADLPARYRKHFLG